VRAIAELTRAVAHPLGGGLRHATLPLAREDQRDRGLRNARAPGDVDAGGALDGRMQRRAAGGRTRLAPAGRVHWAGRTTALRGSPTGPIPRFRAGRPA